MSIRGRFDRLATKGQTTIDFIVAMSVFLAAVGFAFAFVPQMLAPFDDERGMAVTADRAVDQLAGTVLGESTAPGRLNKTCMIAFFHGSGGVDCQGFDSGQALTAQVGIAPTYDITVTLERDVDGDGETDVLCSDGNTVQPCVNGGSTLSVGDAPPSTVAAATARRVVHVDGIDAHLVVFIW